jgi:flavin-dependent dehydrogenase
MYDVIVVGARVAGASSALLFARAGYRVLLVERARFPRDTLSTLYIHQPGVARLARWGVLDAVRSTGCPPLDHAVYQVDDVRLEGCCLPVEGQRAAYAPRRYLLDTLLVEAAVAAGVEYRDGCSFLAAVHEDDRVVGVELRTATNARVVERADLCVGADGMRSSFANAVGAGYTVQDPLYTCAYYTYWTGLTAHFELYERPGRWIGAVPTNDGATLIAAYSPQSQFGLVRSDTLGHYLDSIRSTAPDLFERAMAGERVDRMHGTGDQQNFFRTAAGPGWALVGDAAHHKDSITARGISDAFCQAELLTTLVGDDLHDPASLAGALGRYAEGVPDEMFEGYRNTLTIGRLAVTPDRLNLVRAVARSQAMTDRYFATAAGALSMEDFADEALYEALAA